MIDLRKSKTNILPSIRYSELNIIQKINAKANQVALNNRYNVELDGWCPMTKAGANMPQPTKLYSHPILNHNL